MVVQPGGVLALGRYEVTVGEYGAFVSSTGYGASSCSNYERSFLAPDFAETDRHPVICVSWEDAQAYLAWLSRLTGAVYRLPTEEEWNRAASGSQPGCDEGSGSTQGGPCPVGFYGGNVAGLSDMVGNVWEWTSDCWEDDCGLRVVRGGDWNSGAFGDDVGPGSRIWGRPGERSVEAGFRVARTLD